MGLNEPILVVADGLKGIKGTVLQRFYKEVKRRSDVVEVFNDKKALEKVAFWWS